MTLKISQAHWQGLLIELEQARQQQQLVTYRALIERLKLPTPAMQALARALELLAAKDAQAKQPLRSALVVSQGATKLPRPGFFECLEQLGLYRGELEGIAPAQWHAAEVLRVFAHDYAQENL